GNIQSFIIYQTSTGNVSDINNMGDMTYIGIDAEAWGYNHSVTNAMLKTNNMGNVRITDFGGGNGASNYKSPAFDIEAENLFIINRTIQNHSTNDLVNGNLILIKSDNEPITTSNGYSLQAHHINTNINYNGSNVTSITNESVITALYGE